MGDIHRGDTKLLVQVFQLYLHLFTQLFIQRRKRFVHEQDAWFKNKGAGEGDALSLTTGELFYVAITETVELYSCQSGFNPVGGFSRIHSTQLQRECDILGNRHMRE